MTALHVVTSMCNMFGACSVTCCYKDAIRQGVCSMTCPAEVFEYAGTAALQMADNAVSQASPAADAGSEATDTAKKVRNLQKKLKQIQQLKDKQGSQSLSPEQLQKLASEQSVLADLRELGQDI